MGAETTARPCNSSTAVHITASEGTTVGLAINAWLGNLIVTHMYSSNKGLHCCQQGPAKIRAFVEQTDYTVCWIAAVLCSK